MSTHEVKDIAAPTEDARIAPSAEVLVRAFTDLRDELVGTLLYLLGNREDAQDAAQETFVKCWRTRAGLDDVRNLRAWIFRIALNTATDLQRSAWRRRAKPLMDDQAMPASHTEVPAATVEHQEDLERLRQAIHTLRPEEKEVFLLRQNGEMTYEQIADLRHTPVGTVKTQMRSALQKLRKVLT